MKYFKFLILLLLFYVVSSEAESFPGRPMGDTLIRYFDDELPSVIYHLEYLNDSTFDTTEEIVPIFKDSLVTNIIKYTKRFGDSLLIKSQQAYFSYDESARVLTASLDAVASGKMTHNSQEIYSYQDTCMTIVTKVSLIPGYPLQNFYKNIYYDTDTFGISGTRTSIYLNRKKSRGSWLENRRLLNFTNTTTNLLDSIWDFSLFSIDTARTLYSRSSQGDTSVAITTKYINDTTVKITNIDTTIFNEAKKPIYKYRLKYDAEKGEVIPYSREYFEYFTDSITYIKALFDTAKSEFVYTEKESHLNNKVNKRVRINYYSFDTVSSIWAIAAKDTFVYSETAVIPVTKFANTINEIKVISNNNQITFKLPIKNSHNIKFTIFNIMGKKIYSTESDKTLIKIDKSLFSSGMFFVRFKGGDYYKIKKFTIK